MRKPKKNTSEKITNLPTEDKILSQIKFDLKCKNENQKRFVRLINENLITICSGPPGTGKTFVACAEALKLVTKYNHLYKRVIIAKSVTVLEDEEIGFLKGTLQEKMEPFMESFLDIFYKLIGKSLTHELLKFEIIQIQPLAYLRGKSMDNCIIVLDESQNITLKNMRTALTRIGEDTKMIVMGDTKQVDINKSKLSSLDIITEMFKNTEDISIMKFSREDIVRNPIIMLIEDAFDEYESKKTK